MNPATEQAPFTAALDQATTPQLALRLRYAAGTSPTPRRNIDDVLSDTGNGGPDT